MKYIELTNGKRAIVDDEDYARLSRYKWHLATNRYAGRDEKRKKVLMHREIMMPPPGMVCDHINGDTLDNRKANLRVCTQADNLRNMRRPKRNTSGFKGVTQHQNRWMAQIKNGTRNQYLGMFDTAEQAALAYDHAARSLYGDFARTNH